MLVEKSTKEDIRRFRDKAIARCEAAIEGWMHKKIKAFLNRVSGTELTDAHLREEFVIDKQKVVLDIMPSIDPFGRCRKKDYDVNIYTFVETQKGQIAYYFKRNRIIVATPHFRTRLKQRRNMIDDNNKKRDIPGYGIRYVRNGIIYMLCVTENDVCIVRHDGDFVYHITYLRKDMCSGKKYQDLFSRLEERTKESIPELDEIISNSDILYKWE